MSNQSPLPKDPMPVRTPGLADALRRLAGNPSVTGVPRRTTSTYRSVERIDARARDLYALVRRQSQLFAAVFAGTALALGALVALQTPVFEATALLLLKVGRELIYTPEVGEGKAMTPSPRDKQTVVNSELAIMRSEPVIAGVVDIVGLPSLYPDLGEQLTEAAGDPEAEQIANVLRAKAGERLRESLVVLALPDADVLQVSFRHPDRATAQKAVSVLLDRFTEAHLHAFGEPEVVRFLEGRVEEFRKSLDVAEGAQRDFELAHPAFAEDSPQAALAKRLEELRSQVDAIDAQINNVRLTAVGENSALAQAQRDRLSLEIEASKVKGHLREVADRRLGVVKQFIVARKGEVDGQIAALEKRREELRGELTATEHERVQLPALASQDHDLRRERDANEEQYNTYQKRLRDARFSREMDTEKIASISVIQKSTVTPEAIWPLPPVLAIAVVLLLATMIAGLAATLADHYRWTWPAIWNRAAVKDGLYRLAEHARRR